MSKREFTTVRSEEADERGLALARREGKAFGETLRHMIAEVAENGREVECGDYLVGFAIEKAEGLYEFEDGALQWHEPQGKNVHIEVSVRHR